MSSARGTIDASKPGLGVAGRAGTYLQPRRLRCGCAMDTISQPDARRNSADLLQTVERAMIILFRRLEIAS